MFPYHVVQSTEASHDFFDDYVRPCVISEEGIPSFPHANNEPSSSTSEAENADASSVEGIDPLQTIYTPLTAYENDIPGYNASLEPDNRIDIQSGLRRSTRVRSTPTYLQDFHCNLLTHGTPDINTSPYFFGKYLSYNALRPSHKEFMLNISVEYEPTYYHQALPFTHWKNAMNEELAAMERTKTWSIVSLPSSHHTIGNKWVYKVKYKPDGTVDRYKARLVAKGYNQQEGIDFLDTFSPVAKIVIVKALLTLAAYYNWPLAQMDVNNAFLYGDLFEEVYMALHLGYKVSNVARKGEKLACRLHKSIYGLKQASRQWFSKFSTILTNQGFTQSKADYSLFTKGVGDFFVALLVYVDDIILTGPSQVELTKVKEILRSNFMLKDLGTVKYFLGLELSRSAQGISLAKKILPSNP